MTENEAIEALKLEGGLEITGRPIRVTKFFEGIDVAIKALEEIQRWHTSEINPKIKNLFANTSTQICHNCDHKDEYIEELEAEVEEYSAIGTPEEFRAVMEKQKEKNPIRLDKCTCPSCGTYNEVWKKRRNTLPSDIVYCWHCGQAISVKQIN